MNVEQFDKIRSGRGFIAALDQSGGSTPKALRLYGIDESAYQSEAEMFDLIHQMRVRIITSPVFTGERILGSILFQMTMQRRIEDLGSAEYLWTRKAIVPFLKVDKGLTEQDHGVRLMKPIPDLDDLLAEALTHQVFGTKMRSVISLADPAGVAAIVDQQFELAARIVDAGLVPIIEPEVDIHSPQKRQAEDLLLAALRQHLDALGEDSYVMLKLTLPDQADFYADLVAHPRVLRVVALSGGYTRSEANALLAENHGVVASFSRALTQDLTVALSPEQFDATLDASIASIYEASST